MELCWQVCHSPLIQVDRWTLISTASWPLANARLVVQMEVAAALLECVHATRVVAIAAKSMRHRVQRIAARRNQLRFQFRRPLAKVAPVAVA